MKDWIKNRFRRFPNSYTEYNEETNTGISKLFDDTNKCKASLSFYLPNTNLIIEKFYIYYSSSIDFSLFEACNKRKYIKITSCIKGRGDILLTNKQQQYISGGELSISCGQYLKEINVQSENFEGMTTYIFLDSVWLKRLSEFNSGFIIPQKLYEKFQYEMTPKIIKSNSRITDTTKEIINCLNEGDYDIMSLKIVELLILINKDISLDNNTPTRKYFTYTQMEIAKKTHSILTENLDVRYSAKDLAKRFGISETSLKNYFRGVYGIGYRDYQKNVRMRTAADLLKNTEMKVVDISLKVGFRSQTKFSICFKNFFGVNPLEFRRKSKLENSGALDEAEEEAVKA